MSVLLHELDHEVGVTRRLLERIPNDRLEWKPHPRAFTLGELATHLATLPRWGSMTLARTTFALDDSPSQAPLVSREAILAVFDEQTTAFRAALAGCAETDLQASWTLTRNGSALFSMPRATVLRSFVMNHLIHHRGQLSVYLRQLDVALPSIYGPSADEPAFG